ncbi:hypothetical protein PLESTF_001933400 [Pleodorina starrii]|nr:hypothetical protein PLESTF_001933400 [Pleodorina starrii]
MESWHQQMPRPFTTGGNGSARRRVDISGRCHHGGAAVSAAPPLCTSTDDSRSCRPSPLGSNEPTPAITFTPAAAVMAPRGELRSAAAAVGTAAAGKAAGAGGGAGVGRGVGRSEGAAAAGIAAEGRGAAANAREAEASQRNNPLATQPGGTGIGGQGGGETGADEAAEAVGTQPGGTGIGGQGGGETGADEAAEAVGTQPGGTGIGGQGGGETGADEAAEAVGTQPGGTDIGGQGGGETGADEAAEAVGTQPGGTDIGGQGGGETGADEAAEAVGTQPGGTGIGGQGGGEETERRLQVGVNYSSRRPVKRRKPSPSTVQVESSAEQVCHESVPAALYKCEDIKEARSYLEMAGVVTLEPPKLQELLQAIPDAAEAAIQLCRLRGGPIFQELRHGDGGNYCYDEHDEGRLLMDYGTGGQRWMVDLKRPSMPAGRHAAGGSTGRGKSGSEMGEEGGGEEKEDGAEEEEGGGEEEDGGEEKEGRGEEEEEGGEGADGDEGEQEVSPQQVLKLYKRLLPIRRFGSSYLRNVARSKESVQKAVVLANHPGKPGDPPVGVQATHVDLAPEAGGFVGFMPLAPVSVLVSPGSHIAVQLYHKLREAHPQVPEKGIMLSVSAPKMVRMHMKPGQIVLLHVNTVHAGDAGVHNTWSPRIHFYVHQGDVDNETHPVEPMGPLFAALF